MSDLRALILAKDDRTYEEVPVPEWGVTVTVKSLTAGEKDEYDESLIKMRKQGKRGRVSPVASTKHMRAKMVVKAVCLGVGNPAPMFTDSDIETISAKNGKAIDLLYDVAVRLCGYTESDDLESEKQEGKELGREADKQS